MRPCPEMGVLAALIWSPGLELVIKWRFPDRRVEILREVLTNLACKLRRLLMLTRAWLLSWSCGHVVAERDNILIRLLPSRPFTSKLIRLLHCS
jgi:hypothetical protein